MRVCVVIQVVNGSKDTVPNGVVSHWWQRDIALCKKYCVCLWMWQLLAYVGGIFCHRKLSNSEHIQFKTLLTSLYLTFIASLYEI